MELETNWQPNCSEMVIYIKRPETIKELRKLIFDFCADIDDYTEKDRKTWEDSGDLLFAKRRTNATRRIKKDLETTITLKKGDIERVLYGFMPFVFRRTINYATLVEEQTETNFIRIQTCKNEDWNRMRRMSIKVINNDEYHRQIPRKIY